MPGRFRTSIAGLALLAGMACTGGTGDLRVDRCAEVISYRLKGLRNVEVVEFQSGPGSDAVALRYEAVEGPENAEVMGHIACEFLPGEWKFEHIQMDDDALTDAEVVLVNSELLLRDLSRNPELIAGGRSS